MSAGRINLQANDGKVLSLTAPEGMSDNTVGTVAILEDIVSNSGNQTIAGVKTFSSSPIVPTPTADTQAANKAYVDTKQDKLGFTPVQQGNGIGQFGHVVKIGWSGDRVKITVDVSDIGNVVMDSNIAVANSPLVKTALNASGGAPIYACRAWVNFNGTETVAIRASGNVSSITDNGVGDYTINFITAMPDENYVISLVHVDEIKGTWLPKVLGPNGTSLPYTYSATAVRVGFGGSTGSGDLKLFTVAIFR